jgi:GntP family gluconate:H+ symporter
MSPITIVGIGISTVLFSIIVLRLHAAIALLIAALLTGLITSENLVFQYSIDSGMQESQALLLSKQLIGSRLSAAFGNTVGKIGVLILLASIIGAALMKSGGAERIIRSVLGLVGKKNTPLAFLAGSFTLGIPVFFDTVFYLMIPLVKSISIRNPKQFSFNLMAVIAGGVMAHSLIPPTPGPLFVAKELGVDIGVMMIGGLIVGSFTALSGYIYALWANKKWDLPMRDTADISIAELQENADEPTEKLPSLWFSLVPIILPIFLIAGNTVLSMLSNSGRLDNLETIKALVPIFKVLGDSNIALFISAFIAMILLWQRIKDATVFGKYMTEAISSAGMIILITGAGGAFGQILQQTGIGTSVGDLAGNYHFAILPLAFLITAVVRTAQGSATVAMVTAIGVMSGFQGADGYGFHPVYLALVVGCGSKIFAWMNDSAFWIITKMSGMHEKETIRFFSYLLTVMGFSGLFIIMILARLFPFV